MPHYMLAAHTRESEAEAPTSAEDRRQSWQEIGRLEQEMKSAGVWVFSARLHEPGTATVVRMSSGEVLTTDGPFVGWETLKEIHPHVREYLRKFRRWNARIKKYSVALRERTGMEKFYLPY